MIVQNTIFTTNFFWMDSFDGWTFPLGDAEKKICWTAEQVTVQGKFRVIHRNGFDIITTMIVQNTIFTTNFFRMDSFDGWTFPLGEAEKKICLTA